MEHNEFLQYLKENNLEKLYSACKGVEILEGIAVPVMR